MGYTTYWEFLDWHGKWQKTWPQLIEDTKLIVEAADVLVCGPTPEEFPRHYSETPFDGEIDFYPPICETGDGIWLNGLAEDGHEPFVLRRSHRNHFCKTLLKPYDTIVGCILLRAHQLQPDLTVVCSDGNWDEDWAAVRELYAELWPGELILRPPDLHSVEERPSDPKHSGKWLYQGGGGTLVAARPTVVEEPQKHNQQTQSIPPFILDPEKAINVSTWLSHCDTDPEHVNCKPSPFSWSALPGVHFRLIDVQRRCIVRSPLTPAFATLSYVWGGVRQPMLTSATEPALMQEGGLDRMVSKLPNAIKDAIAFCKSIGLNYLWVDALCIKQDSTKDVKLQMRRMRTIYAGAKVTIVIATGDDANTRLLLNANDTACANSLGVQELANILRASAWYTRGWTYQELVLSHRVVLCTSAGIHTVCPYRVSDTNGRQLRFSHKLLNPSLLLNTPKSLWETLPNQQLHNYLLAVTQYSQRKLSYPKDALNAFQGIIQSYGTTVDNQENAFYYGLPTCAFDQVFCFRTVSHDPSTRRKDFPSWSWLGWSQFVMFDHKMIEKVRTWNIIHPPTLKGSIMRWGKGIEWETADLKNLWRPIEHNPYNRNDNEYGEWGFPSATGSFHHEPTLSVVLSIADLRISPDAVKTVGNQGRYGVFSVRCEQTPPDPPPKMVSVWDLMHQPMPELHLPTEDEKRAPLVPAERQTISVNAAYHAEDFHNSHDECESRTPLGHIWLDTKWRDSRPRNCIMGFVALCGEKKKKNGWIITRLMLTERVAKKERVWGRERVHTMDCKIRKDTWMNAGAEILDTIIV